MVTDSLIGGITSVGDIFHPLLGRVCRIRLYGGWESFLKNVKKNGIFFSDPFLLMLQIPRGSTINN